MIDAGADIILGNHPHVLQPIRTHTAPDGRQALVAYSLGNFVSGYWRPWERSRLNEQVSAVFYIDVNRRDGKTVISNVRHLPTVSVSRIRNRASIIQVAPLADPPAGSREMRVFEKSLHGKTDALIWKSIGYLVRNPLCLLLAASDVMWEGTITLRMAA